VKDLFAGRHFDRDVIILCVRWYLCYKLSFRDLVEMMCLAKIPSACIFIAFQLA
jgi:transposase-like protein